MSSHSDAAGVESSRHSTILSGLRFSLVGLIAYSFWAFGMDLAGGAAGLYSGSAVVFVLLGGLALYPNVRPRIGFLRFCLIFAAAFVAFAVIWCVVYFVLKGKHGEILGFLFGVAAMCGVFQGTIKINRPLLAAIGVAFTFHIAGYLAGDYFFYAILLPQGLPAVGKLAWGACHGFGFGAGLGWVLQSSGSQR